MPRRLGSVLTLALTVLAGSCRGAREKRDLVSGPEPQGLCRGLDVDADARELREDLIRIATSRDSRSAGTRATVGLAIMPADSVVFVNDATICERALAAMSRAPGVRGGSSENISVFRLGHVYVAHRPDGRAGMEAIVLDENMKIRIGWLL